MGVLNIITRREGNFTPMTLAEMIGVSKPMIAAHLRTLLKKGYVRKEAAPGDKRSFYVRPTEKGEALADEFEARQTAYLKTMETKLGEKRFAELVRLLGETQTVLDEMKEVY